MCASRGEPTPRHVRHRCDPHRNSPGAWLSGGLDSRAGSDRCRFSRHTGSECVRTLTPDGGDAVTGLTGSDAEPSDPDASAGRTARRPEAVVSVIEPRQPVQPGRARCDAPAAEIGEGPRRASRRLGVLLGRGAPPPHRPPGSRAGSAGRPAGLRAREKPSNRACGAPSSQAGRVTGHIPPPASGRTSAVGPYAPRRAHSDARHPATCRNTVPVGSEPGPGSEARRRRVRRRERGVARRSPGATPRPGRSPPDRSRRAVRRQGAADAASAWRGTEI
ncbi:hypothetical protein FHR81_000619 [Actinoalloteichus hoggarensis]|uniref:Uncharacterized protein n=1 Tax=Actinoalloteichus hoggarensis TaxID=1470176 RepID=A0A221W1X6_9PSEU|nr:hypothetical protein AHOG_10300 [Actinoalloteichus hoggarensis]MBB5919590.1 hypothetical protein [Actinoalloteichus hoggarensis]